MTPPPGSPHYQLVADELRRLIATGMWTPGMALPSERALTEQYGVSRATVRGALRELRADGLIVTVTGSSSRVRQRPTMWTLGPERYTTAAPQVGWTYQLREQRTAPADARVAALLEVPIGEAVLERHWLTRSPDAVRAVSYSYLPKELSENDGQDRVMGPWPAAVVAALRASGVTIDDIREQVASRPPTLEESAALELQGGGASVLVLTRVMTVAGHPVEAGIDVLPSDRTALAYHVKPGESWAVV